MVHAEVVQAVEVSVQEQSRNSCWFVFSLVPHEGIRRSSAPTGLAVRSCTLHGPRGGFWRRCVARSSHL